MRFYNTDKWCVYYDETPLTDEQRIKSSLSDEQWNQWEKEYAAYFKTIVDKLPKGFVKQFYSNHGFHDFIISDIRIQNKKPNKIIIEIQLDGDYSGFGKANNKILLTYRNVEDYSIIVPQNKRWFFNNMQWLFNEFYLHENGMWSHRIMCDGNCEIKLDFRKISIKKL